MGWEIQEAQNAALGGAMDGKLCPPRVYIEALTPSLMVLEMGLWEVMGSDDIMSVGPSQWD